MKFSDDLTMNSRPLGIAAGPDGALWFTESAAPGRIGRITTEGDITEYSNGLLLISNPWFISAGPDGNMWFTGNNLPGLVARITLPPLVRDVAADEITSNSARLRGKVRPELAGHQLLLRVRPQRRLRHEDRHRVRRQLVRPGLRVRRGRRTFSPARSTTTAWWPRTTRGSPSAPIACSSRPSSSGSSRCCRPRRSRSRWRTRQPEPEFGKTVVADGDGSVRYKAPGGDWQELEPNAELPVGVALDARRGKVNLQDRRLPRRRSGRDLRRWRVLGSPAPQGLRPRGRLPARRQLRGCGTGSHRAGSRTASASRSRKVRRLWGRDSGGRFRSHGRHSHATVRGTRWLTVDRCDGTLTRVTDGSVVVRDFRRHRNVVVRAGHSYLAHARRR